MENFIYTLVVMGISGVTFIAYKHPDAYNKIYPILIILLLITISSIGAWNLAVQMTSSGLNEFIDASKAVEAGDVARSLSFPSWVLLIAPLVISLYLIFLSSLPQILKNENT